MKTQRAPRARPVRARRAVTSDAPRPGEIERIAAGEVRVRVLGELLSCHVLRTSEGPPLQLVVGQQVLVAPLGAGRGCVLGRVEPYDPSADVRMSAAKSMTICCGESSLELTAQGKITVRGVDVVSSAKRKNRIKGGSVEIN